MDSENVFVALSEYLPDDLCRYLGFEKHRDMVVKRIEGDCYFMLKRYAEGMWAYRYKNVKSRPFHQGSYITGIKLIEIQKALNIQIL